MYRILAKTKDMPYDEWLALRRNGIGGSDAGAICGVNPYANALSVFRSKTAPDTEEEENEAVRQGHDLEEYVAQRFAEATGKKVRKSNMMYQSVEYPFMIADVDRLVVGEDAGLECKTASAYNADKWRNGDIPLHYLLQCYHYMIVLGKKVWYIAAVILGQEFVYRKIVWDDAAAEKLIEMERNFWNDHVLKNCIPEPDGSDISDQVLKKYFGNARPESSIELVGFDEKLDRRGEIISRIKALETEQKKIEQEVKMFMRDNERAHSEKYFVSWSNVETTRFDTKKIREEKPELYADYAKKSSSRRFEVKAA